MVLVLPAGVVLNSEYEHCSAVATSSMHTHTHTNHAHVKRHTKLSIAQLTEFPGPSQAPHSTEHCSRLAIGSNTPEAHSDFAGGTNMYITVGSLGQSSIRTHPTQP